MARTRTKRVNSKNATKSRPLLLALLTLVFLYQTGYAIQRYLSGERGTTTNIFSPDRVPFPRVTLCPAGNVLISDFHPVDLIASGVLQKKNESFSEAMAVMPRTDFAKGYVHNSEWISLKNVTSVEGWSTQFAISLEPIAKLIQCVTYKAKGKYMPGFLGMLLVDLDYSKSKHIFVFVSDPADDNMLVANKGSGVYFFKAPEPSLGMNSAYFQMEINMFQRTVLPKPDLPCHPERTEQGLRACLESHFERKMAKCRLPWKEVEEGGGLQRCESEESLQEFVAFFKLMSISSQRDIYKTTGCYQPCTFSDYTVELVLKEEHESSDLSQTLALSLSTAGVLQETEVLLFDFFDMVGNVGGYLGLFLGASVISIYDAARERANKIMKARV